MAEPLGSMGIRSRRRSRSTEPPPAALPAPPLPSSSMSSPWEAGRASTRARSSSSHSNDMAAFTDDLLLEILSRVPAKSLCRFKCVSTHWLSLINHPDHRKKLPQTLTGFFYASSITENWIMGLESSVLFTGGHRDTSFDFVPHPRFHLFHCCNGLLLGGSQAKGSEFRYVVLNPATEKWVAVPYSGQREFVCPVLAFDPAVSSHFHVFLWVYEQDDQLVYEDDRDGPDLAGVAVYSSETGGWVYKEKTWNEHIGLADVTKTVFLNGYLHFLADHRELSDCLAVVDTKGETWMNFPVPVPGVRNGSFIQSSQGRLNYASFQRDEDGVALRLVVYVLENYQSKQWILAHSVRTSYLFGAIDVHLDVDFEWIAIHPDCNLLFFTLGCDKILMCYNMDRRQVKVISNFEEGVPPYLPYVPFYGELQALHI